MDDESEALHVGRGPYLALLSHKLVPCEVSGPESSFFTILEGRRYAVPDGGPGERVELVLGEREIEAYSLHDGRRLARHERGRPARVLPDPVTDSAPLAQVLGALPHAEVHRRPLAVYQDLIDG